MTTREAFKKLLSERGSASRVGKTRGEFGAYRRRIKQGNKFPSEEKMSELLKLAGFEVVQEKRWEGKK